MRSQQREQLLPAPVREQLLTNMEDIVKKDITQYNIFYSEDSEFVSDEVVKDEETLATNLDTDGWPREGRMHRWIKVNEAKKWCKEEKKQLWDVIDAYCDFSTRSGAFGIGEIYVRHQDWQGVLVDIRENAHEDPNVVIMGWKRKQEKTKGELWEEEHQHEETILTRRSREVAKIRWASPLLIKEEPMTQGETLDESNTVIDAWYEDKQDITDIRGEESNMEGDDATNLQVDSSKCSCGGTYKAFKELIQVDNITEEVQEGQSEERVRGVTTPYIFLPLQDLDALKQTIRNTLRK